MYDAEGTYSVYFPFAEKETGRKAPYTHGSRFSILERRISTRRMYDAEGTYSVYFPFAEKETGRKAPYKIEKR